MSAGARAEGKLPEDDDFEAEKNRDLLQGRGTKTVREIGLRA